MDTFIEFGNKNFKFVTNIVFFLAILIISGQILEAGFTSEQLSLFNQLYRPLNLIFSILSAVMSLYLYLITKNIYIKAGRLLFFLISIIYFIISIFWLLNLFNNVIDVEGIRLFIAVFIGFMAISFKIASLGNSSIHPSLLFVLSFVFLILFGTFCLMLPAAAYKNVGFVQALFTSTSAVTVTGLAVLDTGKDFTLFGQTIIMILLQLGGLGILTVTNVFALVFKSTSTFKNRMMVSDMIKELDNKNTFSTLFKIIFITLMVEFVGAIFIYFSVVNNPEISTNPTFFAAFHAVSAFCNGGFSTLSNSLYEESVRHNYFLQLTICWLIITGGLGYSVMINHYLLLKNKVKNKLTTLKVTPLKTKVDFARTSSNTRIILVTTSILLLVGTILFFLAEYNGTLKEHSLLGKIVVSFFNSATPRTAGFNNINMAEMGIPAFMLTMALMWIGASPGSTGGGIKTTTFAVAMLNLWNQIKGKDRLIINFKEIPNVTINQVNAVILLSIFAISFSTFLLAFFNPELLFKDLLFESISAYSTVGLSVGITPGLGQWSQIVLIILMFLGRVSFLTFLIGIFSRIFNESPGCDPYYPKENVIIN